MSTKEIPDPQRLRTMALQHLQSMRAAGLEWLPYAILPINPPSLAMSDSSLFDDAEPTDASLTVAQRRHALQMLAAEVAECTLCPELVASRTQSVFGDGPPRVDLCFVGEGPGADEDKQGLPFVGAAGQLLNKIIAACGFKREEVYICNIVKCRPPGNRTPLASEAANCRSFLQRQLELVQPKFICALGVCAAQNLLQTTQSIARLRGRFHDYHGIPVMCTYHPAFLLPNRSPGKKRDVWEDMKMLLVKMGRPIAPANTT